MSEQIRASHILVSHADADSASGSKLSREDAQKHIENLRISIEDGAAFAEVARENSDCPSAGRGGDLGSFPKGAMVPEFEQAAFALGVGETSGVVETAFGFHLIQRTG